MTERIFYSDVTCQRFEARPLLPAPEEEGI